MEEKLSAFQKEIVSYIEDLYSIVPEDDEDPNEDMIKQYISMANTLATEHVIKMQLLEERIQNLLDDWEDNESDEYQTVSDVTQDIDDPAHEANEWCKWNEKLIEDTIQRVIKENESC